VRHYIEVCWQGRRTLVNLTRLVTVVDAPHGCKIHMQGYCLEVADSYEEVLGRIEAAEAERVFDPKRKPAERITTADGSEELLYAVPSDSPSDDDGGGGDP